MPDACGVQEAGDERNVDELADVQVVHVKERRNRISYLSKKQETEIAKSRYESRLETEEQGTDREMNAMVMSKSR